MTNTDITPELLREISVWLRGSFVGPEPGKALEAVADRLERERADEKRVDELVKVMENARLECDWPGPDTDRSIARAVLAHLEQEGSERYADAKAILAHQNRSARAASESCTKPETQQVTPRAHKPRRWHDLHDVPADVALVTDVDGRVIARPARGWSAYISNLDFAPWTEVIADA